MLSKSQARLFFVGGTALFSLLFLGLTIDTVRQVPKQTKAKNITPEVARGKKLWDDNNCMGCHTLLGEGAYYAPELTKVYERRGPMWMDIFLKDPQAMFPGERKMVQYKFTDQDRKDLIAFFKWIGEMDLNGFPPRPSRSLVSDQKAPVGPSAPRASAVPSAPREAKPLPTTSQPAASLPATAASKAAPTPLAAAPKPMPVQFKALCQACHSFQGQGGKIGPALDGVGKRYTKEYLRKWLDDPQSVKKGTAMPKLPYTPQELTDMVEFLADQK